MKSEIVTPNGEFGGVSAGVFVQRLSATRRGARLARLLAAQQLRDWGVAATDAVDAVELVVAELASNAVRHGRVPGRDFELRLESARDHVRIEVSDPRAERAPRPAGCPDEGGYGLLLVEALATAWGVRSRCVGKTVWATVPLP
ncbi:ATP-binding protein [Streptomyces sp. ms191]|uniref:ATP-binding protein n=1 Tax=Streptomyces sp. ms191 TaxID=1827978 RepID=UPI0011CD9FE4|nr:ATP-binding protein [Streptomyces sp. ms191]TXS30180.1 ATP-binding protein [Streptomyces sp. ms191]